MKKLVTIISTAYFILFTVNLFSQPCLPSGITFSTQDQIDNFSINYPNCTEIEGYVLIEGSNITNLDGLEVLTSLGSDL